MDTTTEVRTDTWRDFWPEYECRTIENFAPSSCVECEAPTQRFYYMEQQSGDRISYSWHGLCRGCELERERLLRELYV